VLEQQTSVTVGSAASRLQEKDAKVKAANIRIKALEKDLSESAVRIAEFEAHSSKNTQESSDETKKLQIELMAQQKEVAILTAKCIPLEKLCAKLTADIEDKDAAAAAAQGLVKAVDKNRLRELEQLGNVMAAQKKDHSKELAAARGELGALQSQLESVRASHQAEME
jgi:thymidylate synthase